MKLLISNLHSVSGRRADSFTGNACLNIVSRLPLHFGFHRFASVKSPNAEAKCLRLLVIAQSGVIQKSVSTIGICPIAETRVGIGDDHAETLRDSPDADFGSEFTRRLLFGRQQLASFIVDDFITQHDQLDTDGEHDAESRSGLCWLSSAHRGFAPRWRNRPGGESLGRKDHDGSGETRFPCADCRARQSQFGVPVALLDGARSDAGAGRADHRNSSGQDGIGGSAGGSGSEAVGLAGWAHAIWVRLLGGRIGAVAALKRRAPLLHLIEVRFPVRLASGLPFMDGVGTACGRSTPACQAKMWSPYGQARGRVPRARGS